jgi:segregation and condensation protein B
MENLKNIIDSLLFVAEETLSLDRLKKILPQADAEAIREAVAALQADYDARPGGFYLAEVAGGYQFRSRPEYTPWIRRMVDPKPLRLSKAAMETLAVIAYKQPTSNTSAGWTAAGSCACCSSASSCVCWDARRSPAAR